MAKQMTKAQVVDENIRLRAQCEVLERKVRELRDVNQELSTQLDEARAQPARAHHVSYWDYVAAVKREQRSRGVRIFSYMSREQWDQARRVN